MNEKMSFKMGVKFAVPVYMGRIFQKYCMKLESKTQNRLFKLNITIVNGYLFCRGSHQYGYVLPLKVSFKMGLFSDTNHTHPGVFILESPPGGEYTVS